MGRAREGQSIYDWIERDMTTLHIINSHVLYEHYRRSRVCTLDYLNMCLNTLARAGKLKRIRRGEFLVLDMSAPPRELTGLRQPKRRH